MAQVTLREYLQEIEDTISAGRIDEAVQKCQHVLAQFPESLEVQRLLGEVYLAQGHMEDAQQALDWILTNDPENVIAYCDRALISERLSDFDTALDCYQQAYELSRGNRDIRQQFNILSAKAGQQGFMFSRAGLARLYMRGGLLPQAIQEWDAVLSVSPDRLDARTGLIEAYWREGLYDEAEELAQQTLQDVPGCAKALLILAHITAPKNMQQAKEYVQRAELLDPDLIMAQELFEDMMMSQSGHPFLKLLKKAPASLNSKQVFTDPAPVQAPAEPVFAHASVLQEASVAPEIPVYEMPTSINLFDWNNLDAWSGAVETPTRPEVKEPPVADVSALPTWSHDTFPNNDVWNPPVVQPQQMQQEPQKQDVPTFYEQNLNASHFDSAPQDADNDQAVASVQQEDSRWSTPDYGEAFSLDEPWRSGQETDSPEQSWMSGVQEETTGAAPAWLTMLTQDELHGQGQPSGAVPPVEHEQPSIEEMPVLSAYQGPAQTAPLEDVPDDSWRDALQAALNTTAEENTTIDEEPFFFGPEWLKSLGATEIGSDAQEQPAQVPTASQAPTEIAQPLAEPVQSSVVEQESEQNAYEWSEPSPMGSEEAAPDAYAWSSYLSPEPQHAEQSIVNTLEDLEHNLLSQGFVPLEPNSLSSIAQTQEASFDEPLITEPYSYTEETLQEEPYQASTLSSALEQLGNLAAPHGQTAYQAPEPFVSAQVPTTRPLDEEPLWVSSFRTVPAPAQQEEAHEEWQEPQYTEPTPIEASSRQTFDMTPVIAQNVAQEQPSTFPNHIETFSMPAFEPVQEPARVDVPVAPAARVDAFFESELETTMKRPAVRLQAMKQPQQSMSSYQSTGNGRGGEYKPASASGSGKDGARSSQERLVKGYQHQLVGDYDEAMQEYRIIIKSAPELLDEVVSNVRALLKLAPKYSAGYRVLGDAYMRQGEYLQAMESYNKALTMAKKARV